MKSTRSTKTVAGIALLSAYLFVAAELFKPVLKELSVGSKSEKKMHAEAWDAFQFLNTSRAFPGKDIPEQAYEEAYRFYKIHFAEGLERPAGTLTSSSWRNIGPNNIGGRTLGIAIDPNDTSIVWLGSASGGLWKSTTGGTGVNAWTYVPTGFPVRGVTCIAMDPSNSNVIYIGTGETYSYGTAVNGLITRPTRGTVGIGILKSTDGGVTWSQSLNWSYHQLRGVRDLKINPLNPNVVYAATTEGVYKTIDGGTSWENVLAHQMVMDLEMDKVDTNVVYAGVGNVTSTNKGIYKTSSSGAVWTRLTNGLPANSYQGRIAITAYPKNNKILYALIADIYSTVGVYYSTNEGVSWTAKNNPFTEIVSYQGWYAKGLCVKSDDSSKSLYGGVNVFKSLNSGNNLTRVSNSGASTSFVHSDIHEIVSNPFVSNKIYVLSDGGLFRSDDFGVTYYECTDGYVTSQFYIGSVSYQDSLYMLGGAQDNYTSRDTGSLYWEPIVGGDGSFNAIDPNDDNIQYASYQYLNIAQSFDRGDNWYLIYSSPGSATLDNPAAFIAPFILCPSNTSIIYAGDTSLLKSTDQGFSFTIPSNSAADNGNKILSMAVSATNPDSLYFATAPTDLTPMHVFRSINGGFTATSISTGLPNRYPRDLAVNPLSSSELYVVFSGFGGGHVYKSSNAGASWTDISTTLPDVPFHTMLIEPNHPDTIFAGGDLGIFVSLDGGVSWNELNSGLPDGVMVFDLVYSPVDDAVVAFTHGNGVYKITRRNLPLGVPFQTLNQSFTQQILSNPVHGTIQLAILTGNSGVASIHVFDVVGKLMHVLPLQPLQQGMNRFLLDASKFMDGTYFVKTEVSGVVKVNKFLIVN